MGLYDINNYHFSAWNQKEKIFSLENIKIPLWHLPNGIDCIKFDTDDSKWLESVNKDGENEIEKYISSPENTYPIERYATREKITVFSDNSAQIESSTRKYQIMEKRNNSDAHYITIKDKNGNIVAEKVYNIEQDDGRKILHSYAQNGQDKFEVVTIYSYKPSECRATETINFTYTSDKEKIIQNAAFQTEYYTLNGKQVNAKKIGENCYQIQDKNGNKQIFQVK